MVAFPGARIGRTRSRPCTTWPNIASRRPDRTCTGDLYFARVSRASAPSAPASSGRLFLQAHTRQRARSEKRKRFARVSREGECVSVREWCLRWTLREALLPWTARRSCFKEIKPDANNWSKPMFSHSLFYATSNFLSIGNWCVLTVLCESNERSVYHVRLKSTNFRYLREKMN